MELITPLSRPVTLFKAGRSGATGRRHCGLSPPAVTCWLVYRRLPRGRRPAVVAGQQGQLITSIGLAAALAPDGVIAPVADGGASLLGQEPGWNDGQQLRLGVLLTPARLAVRNTTKRGTASVLVRSLKTVKLDQEL
jgi:hypothetical protein